MHKELMKAQTEGINNEELREMVRDMRKHFREEEEAECKKNQVEIGAKQLS